MAMSDSRKKKLAMLTRSIARGDFAGATRVIQSGGTPDGAAEADRHGEPQSGPILLADACPGTEAEVRTPAGRGKYWLIRRALDEIGADGAAVSRQLAAILRGARQRFDELGASADLCRAADARPEDLLFLDLETCGFSGTGIFLVGTMFFTDGRFVCEQHFARTYPEEPAILHALADRYARTPLLVTFNGKAFDMNMVRERAAFHGVELPEQPPAHLDLLHESRRLWRGRTPNCRLQTLERRFCGRVRIGDIPGAAIPDAYHRFVDTGDARQVRDIIHHNLLDMLTMAQLLCAALTGCEPGGQ